ncbi:Hypothetical predicted protein [Cloeon dipterum]|uniref:Uncharacterized protein n=1 Tax=Cloeon dipterum TaxID=197152 RepID=A0A8S1DI75_9INSE|nr:Hypothetical predicted protein [Cloeon dipterum]
MGADQDQPLIPEDATKIQLKFKPAALNLYDEERTFMWLDFFGAMIITTIWSISGVVACLFLVSTEALCGAFVGLFVCVVVWTFLAFLLGPHSATTASNYLLKDGCVFVIPAIGMCYVMRKIRYGRWVFPFN